MPDRPQWNETASNAAGEPAAIGTADYRSRSTRLVTLGIAPYPPKGAKRHLSAAHRLTTATGQHFNADRLPQYFTGDLDAPVVLVHLNHKQANAPEQILGWQTMRGAETGRWPVVQPQDRRAANLTEATLAWHGIERVRGTLHLAYAFLRRAGLSSVA
jgi:hypothetical protein